MIVRVSGVGWVASCDECGAEAPCKLSDRPPLTRPPRGWQTTADRVVMGRWRRAGHRCPRCASRTVGR